MKKLFYIGLMLIIMSLSAEIIYRRWVFEQLPTQISNLWCYILIAINIAYCFTLGAILTK